MNDELALAYENAPRGVKVGRILMWIGSILFFVSAIADLVVFILAVVMPDTMEISWSNPAQAVQYGVYPALVLFLIAGGIGGICFILDKGRMKSFATLAAVVMIVVILIDTTLMIRRLIYDWMDFGPGRAWGNLAMNLLDIQISGGIFVLGWFLCKDFVGD